MKSKILKKIYDLEYLKIMPQFIKIAKHHLKSEYDVPLFWDYCNTSRKVLKKRITILVNSLIIFNSLQFSCIFLFVCFFLMYFFFLNFSFFFFKWVNFFFWILFFSFFCISIIKSVKLVIFLIIYLVFFFIYLFNNIYELFFNIFYVFICFFWNSFFYLKISIYLYFIKRKLERLKLKRLKLEKLKLPVLKKLKIKKIEVNEENNLSFLEIWNKREELLQPDFINIAFILSKKKGKNRTSVRDTEALFIRRKYIRRNKIKRILFFFLFFKRSKFYKNLNNFIKHFFFFSWLLYDLMKFNEKKKLNFTVEFLVVGWAPDYVDNDARKWTQEYTYTYNRYDMTFYDLRGFFLYFFIDIAHYYIPLFRRIHYLYWEFFFVQIRMLYQPILGDREKLIVYYYNWIVGLFWYNPELFFGELLRRKKKYWFNFVYLDVFCYFFNLNSLFSFIFKMRIYFFCRYFLKYYVFFFFKILYKNFLYYKNFLIFFSKKSFWLIYTYIIYLFNFFYKSYYMGIYNIFFYIFLNYFVILKLKKTENKFIIKVNKLAFKRLHLRWVYNYAYFVKFKFLYSKNLEYKKNKRIEFLTYKLLLLEAFVSYWKMFTDLYNIKHSPLYIRLFTSFNFLFDLDLFELNLFLLKNRNNDFKERGKRLKSDFMKKKLRKKKFNIRKNLLFLDKKTILKKSRILKYNQKANIVIRRDKNKRIY